MLFQDYRHRGHTSKIQNVRHCGKYRRSRCTNPDSLHPTTHASFQLPCQSCLLPCFVVRESSSRSLALRIAFGTHLFALCAARSGVFLSSTPLLNKSVGIELCGCKNLLMAESPKHSYKVRARRRSGIDFQHPVE